MDVFYYWKNYESDFKNGRIGWFVSDRDKLNTFKDRRPDYIWAFKTPKGCKGQLQLIARLKWSDIPIIKPPKDASPSIMFYDPKAPETVRYINTAAPAAINGVTDLLVERLSLAFRSNFQGENGQQVIEADVASKLSRLAKSYESVPFALDLNF